MHDFVPLLPQITTIIVGLYVVLWWVVRPFSFRYRIDSGHLVVSTFFILPAARIPLDLIRPLGPDDGGCSFRHRVLAPLHLRLLWKPCLAASEGEILVLPHWHQSWLGSPEPEASFEIARERRRHLPPLLESPVLGQLCGDSALHFWFSIITRLSSGWSSLRDASSRHVRSAAWLLIILPLWLTYLDWAGARILAAEYSWSTNWILWEMGTAYFASSAFVLLCGVMIWTLLAFGLKIPLTAGVLALAAAISRLSIHQPWGHELSHAFFDSCDGHNNFFIGVGVAMLTSAFAVTLAASHRDRMSAQAFVTDRDAATP